MAKLEKVCPGTKFKDQMEEALKNIKLVDASQKVAFDVQFGEKSTAGYCQMATNKSPDSKIVDILLAVAACEITQSVQEKVVKIYGSTFLQEKDSVKLGTDLSQFTNQARMVLDSLLKATVSKELKECMHDDDGVRFVKNWNTVKGPSGMNRIAFNVQDHLDSNLLMNDILKQSEASRRSGIQGIHGHKSPSTPRR